MIYLERTDHIQHQIMKLGGTQCCKRNSDFGYHIFYCCLYFIIRIVSLINAHYRDVYEMVSFCFIKRPKQVAGTNDICTLRVFRVAGAMYNDIRISYILQALSGNKVSFDHLYTIWYYRATLRTKNK